MTLQQNRANKINNLYQLVRNKMVLPEEELIATYGLQHGMSRRTVKEYIAFLVARGFILNKDKVISIPPFQEE